MSFPTSPVHGQQYTTASGTMYTYDSGRAPAGAWVINSLAALGVTGVQGVPGVTGAYGGPAGATGAQGLTGLRGVTGLIGVTGFQGATGAQGITGVRGFTGLQGITGISGATGALHVIIDGGDSWITTGVKADLVIPYPVNVDEYWVLNSHAGSISVSMWKDSYANFPPTAGDVIGTAVCSLANKSNTSTSGWTGTLLSGNDVVRINVDSVTGIQLSSLTFRYRRA